MYIEIFVNEVVQNDSEANNTRNNDFLYLPTLKLSQK